MLFRKFSMVLLALLFTMFVNAQGDPGGLGTSSGGGDDVQDVSGGSGTTGGNQGTDSVPIDGEVLVLFALGAGLLIKKLYATNKTIQA